LSFSWCLNLVVVCLIGFLNMGRKLEERSGEIVDKSGIDGDGKEHVGWIIRGSYDKFPHNNVGCSGNVVIIGR